MLATNEYFSVGGGFVVNKETQTAENLYYMDIHPENVEPSRRQQSGTTTDAGLLGIPSPLASETSAEPVEPTSEPASLSGKPRYIFTTAAELERICSENNLTIAQVVWENELAFRTADQIRDGLMNCAFS